jgi:PTH1 family peptidyl-tRNA hydrolase
MNDSGRAVKKLLDRYRLDPADMLVVFDEADLPLGTLRVRQSGGPGTHNGMRSIVAALGTEKFTRLRVGIGGVDSSGRLRDYVLGEIAGDEEPIVTHAIERSVDALLLFVRSDLKRAMNEFNRDVDAPEGDPAEK